MRGEVLSPVPQRVVIIGGGITGLAAAFRLAQRLPSAAITLVESDVRLGGKIITERVDGFVIEGGPDAFLARKPRGVGLCRELGLEPRLQGTNPRLRRTYVARGDRLHDLPEGLSGLIPARLLPLLKSGLLSPRGKLRVAGDYLLPARAGSGDESVAGFVQRRLGREAYDRLVEPLLSGIYAGDGAQLSLAATFPQLRQAEQRHGSLVRGMLAASRSAPAAKDHAAFLAPRAGVAEIVEALAAQLAAVDIRSGTRAVSVEQAPAGYRVLLERGMALQAATVILATPAFVTADLVAGIDAPLASALRDIPYASTATVALAYRLADIPRRLDGYGYLIPRAEGRPVLACTWVSTKFNHRAPDGYGLIRSFVGRAGQAEILASDDDEIIRTVRSELRRTLGITAAPLLQRISRWPHGMPQYTLGHGQRLSAIEQRLAARPGLYLAGHAYRGVGLPDCIASGEQAAETAADYLTQPAPDAGRRITQP